MESNTYKVIHSLLWIPFRLYRLPHLPLSAVWALVGRVLSPSPSSPQKSSVILKKVVVKS